MAPHSATTCRRSPSTCRSTEPRSSRATSWAATCGSELLRRLRPRAARDLPGQHAEDDPAGHADVRRVAVRHAAGPAEPHAVLAGCRCRSTSPPAVEPAGRGAARGGRDPQVEICQWKRLDEPRLDDGDDGTGPHRPGSAGLGVPGGEDPARRRAAEQAGWPRRVRPRARLPAQSSARWSTTCSGTCAEPRVAGADRGRLLRLPDRRRPATRTSSRRWCAGALADSGAAVPGLPARRLGLPRAVPQHHEPGGRTRARAATPTSRCRSTPRRGAPWSRSGRGATWSSYFQDSDITHLLGQHRELRPGAAGDAAGTRERDRA